MDKNRLYIKVGKAVKDLLAGKQVVLQKDDEYTDTTVKSCTDVFTGNLEINFTESLIFLKLENAELKHHMWALAEKLGKKQEDGSIHVEAYDC